VPADNLLPVTIFNPVTQTFFQVTPPYIDYTGPVSLSVGDFDGDGVDDVAYAAGVTGAPHIIVVSGATGERLLNFFAFDPVSRIGASIASGDFNGDGQLDIIVGAGPGGGPHVKVFDGKTGALLFEKIVFDPNLRVGVTVAMGDLDGDGFDEMIIGSGDGDSGIVILDKTGKQLAAFQAFESTFKGGVFVASGDFDGDGKADIVVSAGPGGGPRVQVFDGETYAPLFSYFAYEIGFSGGVRVTTTDIDNDGDIDIITGAGVGGGPRVRGFDVEFQVLFDLFIVDSAFRGGVFVG